MMFEVQMRQNPHGQKLKWQGKVKAANAARALEDAVIYCADLGFWFAQTKCPVSIKITRLE